MPEVWLTAKSVGLRYDVNEKWVWRQQKRDPQFPQGVRFSNGTTRWSAKRLDEYDHQQAGVAADG